MAENYKAPNLCIGTWTLSDSECSDAEKKYQENIAAQSFEISGAPINIFKLLGVHEQGKLIDLTGNGFAMAGGTDPTSNVLNAFNTSPDVWISLQTGAAVLTSPSWIGYNFGVKKTSYSMDKYAPPQPVKYNISTIKIKQSSNPLRRVIQARVERSDGKVNPKMLSFTGVGNGTITSTPSIKSSALDTITAIASTPTTFVIQSSFHGALGTATVGQYLNTVYGSFLIENGTTAFAIGDTFNVFFDLKWERADIINLPNTDAIETVSFKPSVMSPYWRLVPLFFTGVAANEPWEIEQLQLLDYEATQVTNIQDIFFLENRDRDYSETPITLKCQYTPFDAIGDLGKFGLNILDQYVFTCSFARMVELLGRPIVTGDILEIAPELSYDVQLNPVKKFLEVTDTGWAAEGFATNWTPLIFRFQAEQLIPSQEHRDILGTRDTQNIDDATYLEGIEQIETITKTSSEYIANQSHELAPEVGTDTREYLNIDIAADGVKSEYEKEDTGVYIEDGLPPNGLPYGEGYKLPDMLTSTDGDYFRLLYPDHLRIPARLFRYSQYKNKWIYVETDRRMERSSHKPSVQKILQSDTKQSLKGE